MFNYTDSKKISNFYEANGYVHISGNSSKDYKNCINQSFSYYDQILKRKITNKRYKPIFNFRNKQGLPRHIINILKDKNSPIRVLLNQKEIRSSYEFICHFKRKFYVTHSKISFKTPFKETSWMPHQDSGYNKKEGFAIFVCLEDMDKSNGALQVFPGSHKLGVLPHVRKIEDKVTDDGQFYIKNLPKGIEQKSIKAKKGDIIIFQNNCIHQSGNCITASRRLAFICEVSCYKPGAFDGYGKIPYLIFGKLTLFEKAYSLIRSYISGMRYYHFMRVNYPKIAFYLRRKILKQLNLG